MGHIGTTHGLVVCAGGIEVQALPYLDELLGHPRDVVLLAIESHLLTVGIPLALLFVLLVPFLVIFLSFGLLRESQFIQMVGSV